MHEDVFTIEQLAERAGVPVRTVRYYVSEGLLPGPSGRGRKAQYTSNHLNRLLLIRSLVDQRVPLAEQLSYLSGLSDEEVRGLLPQYEQQAQQLREAEAAPSPREYVAKLLSRARTARGAQSPSAPMPLAAPPFEPPPSGDTWQRIELAPGLELHVREDARGRLQKLVDEIRTVAERHARGGHGNSSRRP